MSQEVGGLDLESFGTNAQVSQALNYTGDNLTSVVVTVALPGLPTTLYTQTLGYTGDNLTSISAWVKSVP